MRAPRLLPALVLLLSVLCPLGPAGAAALPPCAPDRAAVVVNDDTSTPTFYVVPDALFTEVWEETNDVPGLQRAACADGWAPHEPDTQRFDGLPKDLGILGICIRYAVYQCV